MRGLGSPTHAADRAEPPGNLPVSVAGMNTNNITPSRRGALLAPTFALCGALAFMAGCASEESHVVSAPPPSTATTVTTQTTQTAPVITQSPTYVTTTPAGTSYTTTTTTNPAPAGNMIIVTSALPAPQQEVVLARPTGDYLWVPGYWTWRESRYECMAGHWEVPPYKGSQWIPPYTEQEGNAYRFHEGHWN